MPEEKWNYRPAPGLFKNEKPQFGPAEERTFAEQVKHVACVNFWYAGMLDGTNPPGGNNRICSVTALTKSCAVGRMFIVEPDRSLIAPEQR
jgi:hypothetical protein